jgi:hypothetical protein
MPKWAAEQQLRHEAATHQINEMLVQLQASGESQKQAFQHLHNSVSELIDAKTSSWDNAETAAAISSQTTRQMEHQPNWGVRLMATQYDGLNCSNDCRCSCHNISRFKSPSFLQTVIGSLCVGYLDMPILSRCDMRSCRRRARPMIKVEYRFPLWLLFRSISIMACLVWNVGPQLLLRTYRTVPLGNLPLRLAIKGDLPGLAKLINERVAYVNDANANNYSLLEVGENSASCLELA